MPFWPGCGGLPVLCDWIAALPGLGPLVCPAAPALAANLLAAIAAVLALVALGLGAAGRGMRGAAATGVVLGALALLAIAAAGPEWRPEADPDLSGGMVVVLIDRSQSVWRDPVAGPVATEALAGLAAGLTGAEGWRAQVTGFGAVPVVLADLDGLTGLPGAIRAAAPDRPDGASDLSAGLAAALAAIRNGGGRGMILLATDGRSAAPEPGLRTELAASGVPVHVVAAGSGYPDRGLIAADLGPVQRIGLPAILRGTILGGGTLRVVTEGARATQDRPNLDTLQAIRAEAVFVARGLEPMTLAFGSDGVAQERTLYTLVRGPARVLVFGPARWADGLDPARWQIERDDPLSPPAPGGSDLVVIDGLVPADFAAGIADQLFTAADGTGILIINGQMRGAITDPHSIADWTATPLSPILPVDSDPRAFVQSPPPRDVVIMIDASGSMGGGPMFTARDVATRIIAQPLPQDPIAIMPFQDSAVPAFALQQASPAVVAAATDYVRRLQVGGGTNPNAALAAPPGSKATSARSS